MARRELPHALPADPIELRLSGAVVKVSHLKCPSVTAPSLRAQLCVPTAHLAAPELLNRSVVAIDASDVHASCSANVTVSLLGMSMGSAELRLVLRSGHLRLMPGTGSGVSCVLTLAPTLWFVDKPEWRSYEPMAEKMLAAKLKATACDAAANRLHAAFGAQMASRLPPPSPSSALTTTGCAALAFAVIFAFGLACQVRRAGAAAEARRAERMEPRLSGAGAPPPPGVELLLKAPFVREWREHAWPLLLQRQASATGASRAAPPLCASMSRGSVAAVVSLLAVALVLNVVSLLPSSPFLEVRGLLLPGPYGVARLVCLLWEHRLFGLVLLVCAFSVCLPPLKIAAAACALASPMAPRRRARMLAALHFLGRWSTLDVMVAVVLCLVLGRADADDGDGDGGGGIDGGGGGVDGGGGGVDGGGDDDAIVDAVVRPGLGCFLGSVLLSMAAVELLRSIDRAAAAAADGADGADGAAGASRWDGGGGGGDEHLMGRQLDTLESSSGRSHRASSCGGNSMWDELGRLPGGFDDDLLLDEAEAAALLGVASGGGGGGGGGGGCGGGARCGARRPPAAWLVAAALGAAALPCCAALWATPLWRVDLPPLSTREWSLRSGLAHLLSADAAVAVAAAALLVGAPTLLAALALVSPCSRRARAAAAAVGGWATLDVLVWALLVYRLEEAQLVPIVWLQPGTTLLFATAALIATIATLVHCAHEDAEGVGVGYTGKRV